MYIHYASSRVIPRGVSVFLFISFVNSFFEVFVCEGSNKDEFWYPPVATNGDEDFKTLLFRQVTGLFLNDLTFKLNRLIVASGINVSDFEWIKSTASREYINDGQIGWLILSGWERQTDHVDAYTSLGNGVVACKVLPDESLSFGFLLGDCHSVETTFTAVSSKLPAGADQGRRFPIMELASLEMEPKSSGALLACCDPLWQADGVHPGGRCRLYLLKNGRWMKLDSIFPGSNSEVRFCSTSSHSVPCLGGSSLSLRQVFSREPSAIPNIEILVGLPFSQQLGEVQLFSDILKPTGTSSGFKGTNTDRNFGNKVVWVRASTTNQRSDVDSITSSSPWLHDNLILVSSSDFMQPKIVALRQTADHLVVQGVITPPTKNETSGDANNFYGFGFSLETIDVPTSKGGNRTDYGILMGSPFESNQRLQGNVGRVYLLCPSVSQQPEEEHRFSVLQGKRSNEYFGYSVASVGDIDGDGIAEVAIGAPALKDKELSKSTGGIDGRVYIHRVTEDCQFDPEPLQILQAHNGQAGDGFGFFATRGIDLDGDGSPELIVSSLLPGVPPYLFTMPRRLRAVCQVELNKPFNMMPFQAGTEIPLTVTVRLFDSQTNKQVEIPKGVLSLHLRTHQVNPDVLFQDSARETVNDLSSTYDFETLSTNGSGSHTDFFNSVKQRFIVKQDVLINTKLENGASLMKVRFSIQPQLGMQIMNLESIPLVVAYRSALNPTVCDKDPDHSGCTKSQQPVVDWSQCRGRVELVQHICVPRPSCSADLSLTELAEGQSDQTPTDTPQYEGQGSSGSTWEPVYGSWQSRNFYRRFRLANRGPTKATGVRVQLQVLGHEFKANQSAGFRLHINRVQHIGAGDQAGNNRQLPNKNPSRYWSVYVGENGTTAFLSAQPYQWIYPGEYIDIEVSMFAEEVSRSQGDRGSRVADVQPGLAARVKSGISDPEAANNYIFLPYHVTYRPSLTITNAEHPPTRLDRRKYPEVFRQDAYGRRVLGDSLGPKLNHTFLIENTGQSMLNNLTFVLKIPFVLDSGHYLVYLPRQFRKREEKMNAISVEDGLPKFLSADGEQVGQCHVPVEQYDPLKLSILIDGPQSGKCPLGKVQAVDRKYVGQSYRTQGLPKYESNDPLRITRTARATDVFMSWVYPANQTGHHNSSSHTFQKFYKKITTVSCSPRTSFIQEKSVSCMKVLCHLGKLKKGDTVRLRWVGWLWAETFFQLNEPDLKLVSSLVLDDWGSLPPALSVYSMGEKTNATVQLDLPEKPPSWHIEQLVVFTHIRRRDPTHMPWWPILVAVVIGLVLVALIVTLVRWCGFFRRRGRAGSETDYLAEQTGGSLACGDMTCLRGLSRKPRADSGPEMNQLLRDDVVSSTPNSG